MNNLRLPDEEIRSAFMSQGQSVATIRGVVDAATAKAAHGVLYRLRRRAAALTPDFRHTLDQLIAEEEAALERQGIPRPKEAPAP